MWNEAIWFNDTCSNMEDREERGRRERAKRERCKEVPRGSISPASEHINRSQPYYSQSKGDENRKKKESTGGKGEKEQSRSKKIPRMGPRHVNLTCDKKHGASQSNMWAEVSRTVKPISEQSCLFCFGGRWREVTQEQMSPNVQILNDTICDTICNTKAIYWEDFSHVASDN